MNLLYRSVRIPKRFSIDYYFFAMIGILLLSFYLRIFRFDLIQFKDDGATICINALHMIKTGEIPLTLAPWKNIGPIAVYLIAFSFLIFGPSPTSAIIMASSILGTLSVLITYMLGKELYNKKTGLFAAFLWGLSPWVILISRIAQSTSFLPLFSLLAIFFLYRSTKLKDLKQFFLMGFFISISAQIHSTSGLLFAIAFIFLLINKAHMKEYIATFLGSMIGALPMIIYALKHNFANFGIYGIIISNTISTTDNHNIFRLLGYIKDFICGFGIASNLGWPLNSVYSNKFLLLPIEGILFIISLVCLSLSIIRALKKKKSNSKLPMNDLLVLSCISIPLVIFMTLSMQTFLHYFLFVWPIYFIAIAHVLSEFSDFLDRFFKIRIEFNRCNSALRD